MTDKEKWLLAMSSARTPSELTAAARSFARERRAYSLAPRYDYTQGPLYYFAQKVCVQMERLGQPSRVHRCFRSPEQQQIEFDEGDSKARPFESAHQFFEGVDIIHKTRGWPPSDDPYWQMLNDVCQNVADDLGLDIVCGFSDWGWDFAHVEVASWCEWRAELRSRNGGVDRPPTADERHERFAKLLPKVRYKPPTATSDRQHVESVLVQEEASRRARGSFRRIADVLKDFF